MHLQGILCVKDGQKLTHSCWAKSPALVVGNTAKIILLFDCFDDNKLHMLDIILIACRICLCIDRVHH